MYTIRLRIECFIPGQVEEIPGTVESNHSPRGWKSAHRGGGVSKKNSRNKTIATFLPPRQQPTQRGLEGRPTYHRKQLPKGTFEFNVRFAEVAIIFGPSFCLVSRKRPSSRLHRKMSEPMMTPVFQRLMRHPDERSWESKSLYFGVGPPEHNSAASPGIQSSNRGEGLDHHRAAGGRVCWV